MLRWRILLGTTIVALLVGLVWLDHLCGRVMPGVWLLPVAVAFTVLASGEVLYLARSGGYQPLAWPIYVGNLLLVLSHWLPSVWRLAAGNDGAGLTGPPSGFVGQWALTALAIGLLLVLAGEMLRYRTPGGVMANMAIAVFGLVYVGVMLGFAIQLRMTWGIAALAAWLVPVKMGDIGAYTIGRLIGRHKMAPFISPGKTVEGALGALVFSCLGSYATLAWLVPAVADTAVPSSPGWGWLPFGLLMGGVGMAGDLAESLLKRDVGCKDSSRWLPGFGGVLDLLDSLLLTAPVAWLCWAIGLVGQ